MLRRVLARVLGRSSVNASEGPYYDRREKKVRVFSWKDGGLLAEIDWGDQLYFDGLDLTNADLTSEFLVGASFRNSCLKNARFESAYLAHSSFHNANLQNASFMRADLCDTSLCSANLSLCSFELSRLRRCDFRDCTFERASLHASDVMESNFADVSFVCTDVVDTWFATTILSGADFTRTAQVLAKSFDGCSLVEVDLSGKDLEGTRFVQADLRYVRFVDANLRRADLRGSDVRGAELSGADLRQARLFGCLYDHTTVWPHAFDPVEAVAVN